MILSISMKWSVEQEGKVDQTLCFGNLPGESTITPNFFLLVLVGLLKALPVFMPCYKASQRGKTGQQDHSI